MFKNYPFVTSTGTDAKTPRETRKNFVFFNNVLFLFSGRVQFYIRLEDPFNTVQHWLIVPAHNIKGDRMSMHTSVRLVILGTFLSIIFVLNECVSTYFSFIYSKQMHFLRNFIVQ